MTGNGEGSEGSAPFKILTLKLDPDLVERINAKAKDLETDVSTFAQWCLLTGLFLDDVNAFVRSKMGED